MATADYVLMLRESLQKKVSLLRDIVIKNEEQKAILEDEKSTPDEWQSNIDSKDELVQQIIALDDGFDSIFKKVEQELSDNREAYTDEIHRMQDLIRVITDLSERVRSQEKINADLARARFSSLRSRIKQSRQSQKAVNNYYNNMMKTNYYDPQFFDNKK